MDVDGAGAALFHGDSGYRVYVRDPLRLRDAQPLPGGRALSLPIARAPAQHLDVDLMGVTGRAASDDVHLWLGYPSCAGLVHDAATFFDAQFDATFDASGFRPGVEHMLCEYTPATADIGPTGQCVFVSPVVEVFYPAFSEEVQVRTLFPAPDQVFTLTCATCSILSSAYIAISCDTLDQGTDTVAIVRSRTASVALERVEDEPLKWRFTVDGTPLETGAHYRLCIDIDGPHEPSFPGDANQEMYVSPVTAYTVVEHDAELGTLKLSLTCPHCSEASPVYIGAGACSSNVRTGAVRARAAGAARRTRSEKLSQVTAGSWSVTLDISPVASMVGGLILCIDLDGTVTALGFGDTTLRVTFPIT